MGNSSIGKMITPCFRKKEVRILIQGLDAAGKTTILYRLKLGEVVTTIPTIGFNVETVEYKNILFTSWDIGGRDKIRPLYRHYYQHTQAIMFVVDSNDRERMEDIRDEIARTVQEKELENCVFAVVANKQDLSKAMSLPEIRETLNLETVFGKHRKYELFGASALKGEGLYEVLDWVATALQPQEEKQSPQTDKSSDFDKEKENGDKMSYLTKPLYKLKELIWS